MTGRKKVQLPRRKAPGRAAMPAPEAAVRLDAVTRRLLGWFSRHARDLPWRRTRDPYALWLSEVMLQQTQVQTVVPYWERWMQALPTLRALSEAAPEQVLKLWEGLGYYRRARHLHRAAQWLVRERGGRFPRRLEEVLALPGVGRYTAGAICSLAFNQPVPVLDGNVARVLARLFLVRGRADRARVRARLWRLAGELVSRAARERRDWRSARTRGCAGNCALLNQALMELGAVCCTPRAPRCPACPLRRWCLARAAGLVESVPGARRRPAAVRRRVLAFAVEHRGRLLVRQRPEGGVNGRLWEFPNLEVKGATVSPARAARRCLRCGLAALTPLGTLRHSVTRWRIVLEVYRGRLQGRRPRRALAGSWRTLAELEALALAGAHRKMLERLRQETALRG